MNKKHTETRVQKVTSKGQITLPKIWRDQMGTNLITVSQRGDRLEITPAHIQEDGKGWVTIYSAERDTKGKPVSAKALAKKIQKIDG